MVVKDKTLEIVKELLEKENIDCNIMSIKEIKKGKNILHITDTPFYICVKEKKNSNNIYFLYRMEVIEFGVIKNHWLMSSIDVDDVINKLKEKLQF